jgi:alkylation response protein AidB-like acyl-CoA dehydrogenase
LYRYTAGGPGIGGISLLLVERGEGLETKPIKTSYSPSAGTAYVTYDDVKVPVGNLLGVENQGFKCIMHNFNHERWYIVAVGLYKLNPVYP